MTGPRKETPDVTDTRPIPALDLKAQRESIRPEIEEAVARYVAAVKDGSFPGPEHCY